MKRILSILLAVIFLSVLCVSFSAQVDINGRTESDYYIDSSIDPEIGIAYRLYLPENYTSNKKYPLLIFLHGAGERGEDGKHLLYVEQYRYLQKILDDEELRSEFIFFAPQCPKNMRWVESDWTPGTYDFANTPQSVPEALVMSYVEKVIFEDCSVDRSRIYVTGLSMGGYGTWDLLARYPDLFAAAVTVCGGCDVATAETVKDIPVRIFHAEDDPTVSIAGETAMYEALSALGSDIRMTVLHGCGHAAWNEGYADEETFQWLIRQQKTLEPDETIGETEGPETADEPDNGSAGVGSVPILVLVAVAAAVAVVTFLLVKKKK